jgi:hypothetical protein
MGFSIDHKSLKIGAIDVERISHVIGQILSRLFKVEQDPNHLKVSKTSTISYWIVRILCKK